jgi:hypothetical protein
MARQTNASPALTSGAMRMPPMDRKYERSSWVTVHRRIEKLFDVGSWLIPRYICPLKRFALGLGGFFPVVVHAA